MKNPTRRPVRSAAGGSVAGGSRGGGAEATGRPRQGSRASSPMRSAVPSVATIRDVARAAGVSVATVSRVLNGSAPVREDTDRQVRTAAQRLNYFPNGAARSLITNRTHTIGVLLPDLHGEFFSEVIRGIDLASRLSGLHLLVSSSHAATDELVAALRSMRGRIDGLIVMAPEAAAPRLVRECALGAPTVLLNPGRVVRGCGAISIANYDGAFAVTRHLIDLGHRHIAVVTGPEGNTDAGQRLDGFRGALREAGLSAPDGYEVVGDFREPSGYEAASRLLQLKPRPTAVFVSNDRMAVGVLGGLSDAGLSIPADMALAGFDDIEVAQYVNPSLTTVHVDAYRLGERAFEQLMQQRDDPEAGNGVHEVLPTTLVVRASCGARGETDANARVHRSELTNGAVRTANRASELSGTPAAAGKPQKGARR